MPRLAALVACSVALLGACSSSDKKATPSTTTAPARVTTTTLVSAVATTSMTSAITTTTTGCPTPVGSTGPVSTPVSQQSALLHGVSVTSAACSDRVVFDFDPNNSAPPSCTVDYRAGPFAQDASGAPVTIAGSAFLVVRCAPAYSYDYETGRTTYSGPKDIEPKPARWVRQVTETGDNEGVVTWVVGLTSRRPFAVTATGAPTKQLVITIS